MSFYVFNKALKNKHTAWLQLANSVLIFFKPTFQILWPTDITQGKAKTTWLSLLSYTPGSWESFAVISAEVRRCYLKTSQHEQNRKCFWSSACDPFVSGRTLDCDSFRQWVAFPTIFLISVTCSWIPRLAHKCTQERKKKVGFNQEIWKSIPQIIKANEICVRTSTPDDGETWWMSGTWQSKVCNDVS